MILITIIVAYTYRSPNPLYMKQGPEFFAHNIVVQADATGLVVAFVSSLELLNTNI